MAHQTRLLSITIPFFGLVLILFCTLFPFNFLFEETFFSLDQYFFILGGGISNTSDMILNVLLFLPLGFGLTGYLMQKKSAAGLSVFGVILLVSLGLSYSIEILQVFQPSRAPSLFDVFSNCAGGLLGHIFFRWFSLGYFALAFVISVLLQSQTDLSNWERTFPLLLGNELTEDRPWEGYIFELHIADRVISKEEIENLFSGEVSFDPIGDSLLASYQLSGAGEYLTQRIIETSQFTLMTTVATNETIQTGPARIVSLLKDPGHRNFTLGQEENDLIFRLRTPLAGANGIPQLIVHDLFSTTDQRNLIISYNGSVLQIYVDGANNFHVFEFSPGAVAFSYFFPIEVSTSFLRGCKIIWYAIIFIPLGILVSLNNKMMKRQITLINVGILLPSFILESILVIVSGRDLILENILISMIFAAGPIVLFKIFEPVDD